MRRKIVCLLVLLSCGQVCGAARKEPSKAITDMIAKAQRGKAVLSAHFCDAETGRTLFAHNADLPMIPASNMKLVTSAAATDRLGAQFAYQTVFALLGDDLVVIGSGDPLTGQSQEMRESSDEIFAIFAALQEKLAARNIKTIAGDLLIDDTIFDDVRFHSSWPVAQANRWYAAQVAALNFNGNCVDIHADPAVSAAGPVTFRAVPDTAYATVRNNALSTKSGRNTIWASRKIDSNDITLRGRLRSKQTVRVAIDRPSAYFGFVLAEYLLQHGITIEGKMIVRAVRSAREPLAQKLDVLLRWRTPLKDVLAASNQLSMNLAAECLLKTLGAYRRTGDGQGSWDSGRNVVHAFLSGLGIDAAQFHIDDGSGLSDKNRLSARALTTVLRHMHNHEAATIFRDSLSTPQTGTLNNKRRFGEPGYSKRLYAKTGYITGARALSGYYRSEANRWVAFAVLVQNGGTTEIMDNIVKKALTVLDAQMRDDHRRDRR